MHINAKTKILILGISVIIIGIMIEIIPIFIQKEEEKHQEEKIEDYIQETSQVSIPEEKKEEKTLSQEEYLLILEIPKINLKRGVYPLTSELNTIEKNVAIMKESSLPTKENGNLVLEAHNGTARISYFNELHRLQIGDVAYIYYQGMKYIYQVDTIYDVLKDGDVEVMRDEEKNTLTLITCKKDTEDRQLVIILYLLEKEKY